MASRPPATIPASVRIKRRFVNVGGKRIHLREAGEGRPVVLLHDSPRSSRLHIDLMRFLAPHFHVVALDTPGYGNSDPLGIDTPEITDFAAALGDALDALKLSHAPIYATHTSAKIALEYAFSSGQPPALILDGLSYPPTLAPAPFVDAYMRPFVIDANGAYIAAEWTRTRDMLRWFPWFSPAAAHRVAREMPPAEWIEDYTIDLFSAGPHYADAYGAAMRYDCGRALRGVTVPTLIAARQDDVLYGFLDRIPLDENPALKVERLEADRHRWREWLLQRLGEASDTSAYMAPCEMSGTTGYFDHAEGQIHYDRRGPVGETPLLILEAPAPVEGRLWQAALEAIRDTVVLELPGFGESDALEDPSPAGYVAALQDVIAQIGGPVDILAIGPVAHLALSLAGSHPESVRTVALDGVPQVVADRDALCPPIGFDMGGGHLHRAWHMVRDAQVQWPWYSREGSAQRQTEASIDGATLHRALVGTIKQPVRYGDALHASQAATPSTPDHPVLVFTREDDPFHAGAPQLARSLSRATCAIRPDRIADAAPILSGFLAARQTEDVA
ncbi:alpha/beta fold hydrolase [Novosphingobium gossypii]|uniref:alpha/beta fold hydrolase n=1 Tax=Novosphingobium gossypii TaxID=1604774 RepID=UPI003D1ACF7A